MYLPTLDFCTVDDTQTSKKAYNSIVQEWNTMKQQLKEGHLASNAQLAGYTPYIHVTDGAEAYEYDKIDNEKLVHVFHITEPMYSPEHECYSRVFLEHVERYYRSHEEFLRKTEVTRHVVDGKLLTDFYFISL